MAHHAYSCAPGQVAETLREIDRQAQQVVSLCVDPAGTFTIIAADKPKPGRPKNPLLETRDAS